MRLVCDARLAEEAVLLRIARAPRLQQVRFRIERDAVYESKNPDARDAGFQRLHHRWFARLRLDAPLHRALAERRLDSRIDDCRVIPAASRRHVLADLDRQDASTAIVVRVTADLLADEPALTPLIRHELLHVADMLDPAFGYRPELPDEVRGTLHENVLRDRYRVVWDATIDGRLVREGRSPAAARHPREAEFARTFPMLGERIESAFARWFDDPAPTHDQILRFVRSAGIDSESASAFDGRCVTCRFPVTPRDLVHPVLPDEALAALERAHPAWRRDRPICRQCADLFEARWAGTASG